MLNTKLINETINNLCYENEKFEEIYNHLASWNIDENPQKLELFINNDEVIDSGADVTALVGELERHHADTAKVSPDDIKLVFLQLKNRVENPRGEFDKAGRFYVIDSDLIDVRAPSVKYPYPEMTAARTAKFVKALVEKYKPQNLDDLKSVAFASS